MTVLDGLTSAGAWSFNRLLRSAYSGAAFRVRRSSDNNERDIGFAGSGVNVDIADMLSFVGANDGYVVKVYGQDNTGRDLTAPTSSEQPQIVASGVPVTLPNIPMLAADFITDTYLERSDACGITGNTGYGSFAIYDVVGKTFSSPFPLFYGFGSTATAGQLVNFAADASTRYDNGNRVYTSQMDGAKRYAFLHPNGGQYNQTDFFIDGVSIGQSSSANGGSTPNFSDSLTTMGAYIDLGVGGSFWSVASQWSEWILIDAVVSAADRDALFEEQHHAMHGQPALSGMAF